MSDKELRIRKSSKWVYWDKKELKVKMFYFTPFRFGLRIVATKHVSTDVVLLSLVRGIQGSKWFEVILEKPYDTPSDHQLEIVVRVFEKQVISAMRGKTFWEYAFPKRKKKDRKDSK